MKRNQDIKHWYDLQEVERSEFKDSWRASHWNRSFRKNIKFENRMAILGYHIGAIAVGFFIASLERPVLPDTINLIIGAVGATIFIGSVIAKIQVERNRKNEFRKYLREKHSIIYN